MIVKYDLPIPHYGTKTIVVKNGDNVLCNIFYEIIDDAILNNNFENYHIIFIKLNQYLLTNIR